MKRTKILGFSVLGRLNEAKFPVGFLLMLNHWFTLWTRFLRFPGRNKPVLGLRARNTPSTPFFSPKPVEELQVNRIDVLLSSRKCFSSCTTTTQTPGYSKSHPGHAAIPMSLWKDKQRRKALLWSCDPGLSMIRRKWSTCVVNPSQSSSLTAPGEEKWGAWKARGKGRSPARPSLPGAESLAPLPPAHGKGLAANAGATFESKTCGGWGNKPQHTTNL